MGSTHSAPEAKLSGTINTKPQTILQMPSNTKTHMIMLITKSSVCGFVKKILISGGHKKLRYFHFSVSIVVFEIFEIIFFFKFWLQTEPK